MVNLYQLYFSSSHFLSQPNKKRSEERRVGKECLDERGRGREKWWGPVIFSLGPPQFNLSKMGEKRRKCLLDKIALLHLMTNFLSLSTVFVFPFLFFFFFFFLPR